MLSTAASYVIIDTKALVHNFQQVKRYAPQAKVVAVIKANGYGHGIVVMATALSLYADAFAVARIEEAIALRQANIQQPILLLEGIVSPQELKLARQYHCDLVIHSEYQVELLKQYPGNINGAIWLKLETGMHRLGLPPEKILSIWQQCQSLVKHKTQAIKLISHLANADDIEDATTLVQHHCFAKVAKILPTENSLANSAGILAWPLTHYQWVRAGIMLYGISPFGQLNRHHYLLKPVMSLYSRIVAIQSYQKGDKIGYGGTWTCPEAMPVGVVSIGYGDGYPRHAKNGTPVLVNGKRAYLVGRVSMDMLCVDLRGHAQVNIGDTVTLWGQGLAIEEIADWAGTIAYELVCHVTNRVDRIVIE